jgi:hypothetical protein
MDIRAAFIERKLKRRFKALQNALEGANYPTWLKLTPIDFSTQREAPSAAICITFPKYGYNGWLYIGKVEDRKEFDQVLAAHQSEISNIASIATSVHTYNPRWFN